MKLLLDRKEVNPDSRDNYGQSPLWCAAEGGHEGVVKLLLDRKEVRLERQRWPNVTLVCCRGQHEAIVKLLQRRADTESDTGANDPPSYLLELGYEGLAVSQPPPQPPRVVPDMFTPNTHPALSSAVSLLDTPDTNPEISPHLTLLL